MRVAITEEKEVKFKFTESEWGFHLSAEIDGHSHPICQMDRDGLYMFGFVAKKIGVAEGTLGTVKVRLVNNE